MADPITIAASAAAGAAGKALGNVIATALENLGKIVSSRASKISTATANQIAFSLRRGFQEYLENSYNRSKIFKTILSPHEPLNVKDHYIQLTLTCGKKVEKDEDVINEIHNIKSLVVTGLAGSGKSMLMKYMTLRRFENSSLGVPLFVELRHINSFSEKNILTFIRAYCTDKDSGITEEQFIMGLKTGALMLILDGFDELNFDIRDEIQKQIMSIRKEFPEATIVISSRPDSRFGSWTPFFVYKVENLSLSQLKNLIKNLPYDRDVKKRFSREIDDRLYISHKSFLSYPLLATIMLLTYESFAEIPDKMHAFYSQSFDTLFQKHDAQKEQFRRKTYTGLAREDFRSCFAAFCALSYLKEKYSFDDQSLIETANHAVRYLRQNSTSNFTDLNGKQLINDLHESVCMLQQDGLEMAFVHRSFQEYFSAVFATSLHSSKIKEILDNYAMRLSDSAVTMAFDMDKETVEKEWVMPTIDEFIKTLRLNEKEINYGHIYKELFGKINLVFRFNGNESVLSSDDREILVDFYGFNRSIIGKIENLCRMYRGYIPYNHFFQPISAISTKEFWKIIGDEKNKGQPRVAEFNKVLQKRNLKYAEGSNMSRRMTVIEINENDHWWLEQIGVGRVVRQITRGLKKIQSDIKAREKERKLIISDFL